MTNKTMICPRCTGNGYIKIPNKNVDIPKSIVAQCTMCESKGEIDEVDMPINVAFNYKLQ
jgi:DnaJ-class molecular chaperone